MNHHAHHLIGQGITSTAFWQVFLAIVVAYTTYYFADRSRRKSQLIRAKSGARQYGDSFNQAYFSRLEGELHSNYYDAMSRLSITPEDKNFFREMAKLLVLNIPAQSIEVSNVYGNLIEKYGLIEQLSNREDFDKIRNAIDDFLYERGAIRIVPIDSNIITIQEAKDYLQDGKQDLDIMLKREIRDKNKDLTKKLRDLNLRFF